MEKNPKWIDHTTRADIQWWWYGDDDDAGRQSQKQMPCLARLSRLFQYKRWFRVLSTLLTASWRFLCVFLPPPASTLFILLFLASLFKRGTHLWQRERGNLFFLHFFLFRLRFTFRHFSYLFFMWERDPFTIGSVDQDQNLVDDNILHSLYLEAALRKRKTNKLEHYLISCRSNSQRPVFGHSHHLGWRWSWVGDGRFTDNTVMIC